MLLNYRFSTPVYSSCANEEHKIMNFFFSFALKHDHVDQKYIFLVFPKMDVSGNVGKKAYIWKSKIHLAKKLPPMGISPRTPLVVHLLLHSHTFLKNQLRTCMLLKQFR